MLFRGTLLAESLRKEAPLQALPLDVQKIWRADAGDPSANLQRIWRADAGDPSANQPVTWPFIEFEVSDDRVDALAESLTSALEPGPWYCDLGSDVETFVVFANRVFRYRRGDQSSREGAENYARSVGVPEAQIDWPV